EVKKEDIKAVNKAVEQVDKIRQEQTERQTHQS
ncbi:unnamed protein product, partial [marine sediment metagenome]